MRNRRFRQSTISPEKSIRIVRIGSASTQAVTRVITRYLKESIAKDSSASICSVTRIPASSEPMPAPTRPATSSPVTIGPSSRNVAIVMAAGINDDAPNRVIDARVCIDMTMPAIPHGMINGTERDPTSLI